MKNQLPNHAQLIPNNARRVFAGKLFEVYQWPQTMFDGSVQTFEMLRRPDTVQIIVVRGHDLLLIKEQQPGRLTMLSLPGGRVDATDGSWLEAAQRELLEETGIVCEDWRLLTVSQPTSKIEWFASVFLAHNITRHGQQELDAGGESITCSWHSFDDFRQRIMVGDEVKVRHLVPLFTNLHSIEAMQALPDFSAVAKSTTVDT